MASKVTAPLIGAELDPDDPGGSAQNVVLGIIGTMLTIGIIVIAQNGYNQIATNTPDFIPEAEVV